MEEEEITMEGDEDENINNIEEEVEKAKEVKSESQIEVTNETNEEHGTNEDTETKKKVEVMTDVRLTDVPLMFQEPEDIEDKIDEEDLENSIIIEEQDYNSEKKEETKSLNGQVYERVIEKTGLSDIGMNEMLQIIQAWKSEEKKVIKEERELKEITKELSFSKDDEGIEKPFNLLECLGGGCFCCVFFIEIAKDLNLL